MGLRALLWVYSLACWASMALARDRVGSDGCKASLVERDCAFVEGIKASSIQVMGLGLSRTSTQSLALALKYLGYTTLHAEGSHPAMPLGQGNQLTEVVTSAATEYFEGSCLQALAPALQLIEDMGIQAIVDLPWSACGIALVEAHPSARVIVTVRDSAEQWYTSYWEHFRWGAIFPPCLTHTFIAYWRLVTNMTGCGFVTSWPPWPPTKRQRTACIESYHRHVEELRAKVPAGNLLVFNVKDGWIPLCHFLGVEVPNVTFPRHDAYTILHWHGGPVAFALGFYGFVGVVLGGCLVCATARLNWGVSWLREKVTTERMKET
eukprot:TRINITY_DN31282_c0_g1_i1.p1 TRINITY_DN31282_c0_g1~~TRINITY_DN31282_c0_g1_i1.p1  ORF type:complete len:321 (+),score=29.04 TRINITY_DN31282_c0_g1_i1:126-1088(+)